MHSVLGLAFWLQLGNASCLSILCISNIQAWVDDPLSLELRCQVLYYWKDRGLFTFQFGCYFENCSLILKLSTQVIQFYFQCQMHAQFLQNSLLYSLVYYYYQSSCYQINFIHIVVTYSLVSILVNELLEWISFGQHQIIALKSSWRQVLVSFK